MQTLGLDDDIEFTESNRFEKNEDFRFWKRQFKPRGTWKQYKFDWLFGVTLPVVCVMADPFLFRTWGFGEEGLLWMFKPFAYLLSFVSILTMMAWLIWGDKLKGFSALISGLFLAGGLVSLGVGVLISPLSILGIAVYGIGILGFVPLISAFVYVRNAFRAFWAAEIFLEGRVVLGSFILSAVFSLVVPWVVNVEVDAQRPYHEQWFRDFRGL